jgi:hypothetical protein
MSRHAHYRCAWHAIAPLRAWFVTGPPRELIRPCRPALAWSTGANLAFKSSQDAQKWLRTHRESPAHPITRRASRRRHSPQSDARSSIINGIHCPGELRRHVRTNSARTSKGRRDQISQTKFKSENSRRFCEAFSVGNRAARGDNAAFSWVRILVPKFLETRDLCHGADQSCPSGAG